MVAIEFPFHFSIAFWRCFMTANGGALVQVKTKSNVLNPYVTCARRRTQPSRSSRRSSRSSLRRRIVGFQEGSAVQLVGVNCFPTDACMGPKPKGWEIEVIEGDVDRRYGAEGAS